MSIMEMVKPKFSVIIPVYNSEKYLVQCIDSVLSQSYGGFEILFCDDCSSDGSMQVIENYKNMYPKRIKVFKNDVNMGSGFTRDILLKEATGEYFAFLDSDDWWEVDKLQKCLLELNANDADIVYHDVDCVDELGHYVHEYRSNKKFRYWYRFIRNPFPTSGTVVRGTLVGAREMPKLKKRQDYAYWLNVFRNNKGLKAIKINEGLGSYRLRPGSLSSNKFSNVKYNYLAFRAAGYPIAASIAFVIINICERILRILVS